MIIVAQFDAIFVARNFCRDFSAMYPPRSQVFRTCLKLEASFRRLSEHCLLMSDQNFITFRQQCFLKHKDNKQRNKQTTKKSNLFTYHSNIRQHNFVFFWMMEVFILLPVQHAVPVLVAVSPFLFVVQNVLF